MEAAAPDGGGERRQRKLEEEERRRRQNQDQATEEEEHAQAVYCAVGIGIGIGSGSGSGSQEWKANLRWVLAALAPRRSSSSSRRLVLAHLRRPTSRINIMGAWVPVSQLAEEEVAAYRQLEEERIGKVLDDLLEICQSQKVNASKIVIASDDIARGLVQLVEDHGVTELVMGAASDRAYSRKMRTPRSKKALTVQLKANPSCRGNLICTREAGEGHAHRAESSTASSSPRSDCSRSKSSPCLRSCETFNTQESDEPSAEQTVRSGIEDSNHQATAIAGSSAESISEIVGGLEIEEDRKRPGSDAGEMDGALYEKLKHAAVEAESLKHEAYEETRRRQMAERELAEASRMADEAERSYEREARHRKALEEMVARERAAMEQGRRELVDVLEKAREADGRSAELELQIASSERAAKDLEATLSESYGLLDALRRQGGDHPFFTGKEDGRGEQRVASFFLQLGYSELDEATKHFDESARIDGGRGKVYGGELHSINMPVAVKAVDEAPFAIAAARSLEDRLGPGPAALPWQARCGVAYGACSALAFLHSTLPRATVHGDVRPANILVVEEDGGGWSCMLAGLGARGLVDPGGGAADRRAYADPAAAAAGEGMTPRGDVYALGVVLLRLVTGMPAFLARKAARDAAGGRASWRDVAAGGWPPERAREVGLLGLRCCGVDVEAERPLPSDSAAAAMLLLEEARAVLEAAMMSAAAPAGSREWEPPPPSSSLPDSDSDGGAPPYFLCPIVKEVMRDPQVAGDGFTYEAEAIGEWLRGGHDTSPMTNLKLPTRKLVPNHALRNAIHEWRHRQLHAHPSSIGSAAKVSKRGRES